MKIVSHFLTEVAFLFFVRKFPTGKSEFSGLILPALPGNMHQLIFGGNVV
jgi:hypothetical protein